MEDVMDTGRGRGRGRGRGTGRGRGRGKSTKNSAGRSLPTKSRGRGGRGKRAKAWLAGGPMNSHLDPGTGEDVMDTFLQISATIAEPPERNSESEPDTEDDDYDGDNDLRDPDDEVMKLDKKAKGKRGRKKKQLVSTGAEDNSHALTVCPFPLSMGLVSLLPGRRSRKREFTEDLDTENSSTICTLFKPRKSLKLGKDPCSIVTNKLYSIKATNWFEKRVNTLPMGAYHNQIGPIFSLPGTPKLMQIMWTYHTNWIINKAAEQRRLEAPQATPSTEMALVLRNSQKSLNMDWVAHFLYYFRQSFEEVFKVEKPDLSTMDMKNAIHMFISFVVDITAKEMTRMSWCHFNAYKGVNNLSDVIKEAIAKKDHLLEKMELEHHRLMTMDSKLDEGSIWGLKPLRRSLAPPYFKTSDGLASAPPHPTVKKQSANNAPFFNFNKQKWTTKDLEALRVAIRDVLIEKNLLGILMTTDTLLRDCADVHDQAVGRKLAKEARGEVFDETDETPKRRGRPKKFGQSAFLGVISPHLYTIASPFGNIVVRYQVNNIQIEDWRDKREDRLNKLQLPELLNLNVEIDWFSVSNKATLKTKKNRTADDCRLAFVHEAHPKLMRKRWSAAETAQFRELVKQSTEEWNENEPVNIDWDEMNKEMGNHRTGFQMFYRWRNNIAPPKKMAWNTDKVDDFKINALIKKYEGNWKKVAVQCGSELATKKQVIDRYKKNSNSSLKAGSFERTEDALLLLTIEKLKGHLGREGHFGELIAYLPWRFETVWRDRAGNLFADWIVPWKIEEDKKLLELANSMSRNWRKIADSFDSFKNRKGCLTRWKILQRRLKTCSGVEEYHEAYSMIRYNVFQYKHLKEVLTLLKNVYKEPVLNYEPGGAAASPTTEDLQNMLLGFNRVIMASAIISLTKYIAGRDAYWEEWATTHGERKRTFDRRTFHPDNPQSVASALHIRGICLKPQAGLTLTEFQSKVYVFYARFCKTKALKKDAKRPYLPGVGELISLTEIKDIVDVSTADVEAAAASGSGTQSRGRKRKPYRKAHNAGGPAKGAKRGRKAKKKEEEESEESEIELTESESDFALSDSSDDHE